MDVFREDEYVFGTDVSWRYNYDNEYKKGVSVGYVTQFMKNIDFNSAQIN